MRVRCFSFIILMDDRSWKVEKLEGYQRNHLIIPISGPLLVSGNFISSYNFT